MVTMQGNNGIYEGLDNEKPSGVPENTLYHALDTDKWYFYNNENWTESPQSGGGFTPTETQLNAINSGITAADVQQIDTNKTNILSIQDHIKFSANSKTYYLQPEQPSNPVDGDIWIG